MLGRKAGHVCWLRDAVGWGVASLALENTKVAKFAVLLCKNSLLAKLDEVCQFDLLAAIGKLGADGGEERLKMLIEVVLLDSEVPVEIVNELTLHDVDLS